MKSLILSIFALFTITMLSAQTTIKPGVGMNFTNFSNNIAGGDFTAKAGWQLGGSVAFGKKFYIEPGIFYTAKSTQFQSSNNLVIPDSKTNINGIRIPVAAGLNLIGNDKSLISLRGFGGLSGFFLTGVGEDLDKDQFEKFNFGVFAGVGFDFWRLFLDVSYEWSLSNVQSDISLIDVGKSRSIFLTAGLRIPLKK